MDTHISSYIAYIVGSRGNSHNKKAQKANRLLQLIHDGHHMDSGGSAAKELRIVSNGYGILDNRTCAQKRMEEKPSDMGQTNSTREETQTMGNGHTRLAGFRGSLSIISYKIALYSETYNSFYLSVL